MVNRIKLKLNKYKLNVKINKQITKTVNRKIEIKEKIPKKQKFSLFFDHLRFTKVIPVFIQARKTKILFVKMIIKKRVNHFLWQYSCLC